MLNPNFSRLTDREAAMEGNAIERLLIGRNQTDFERKLYRRGEDLSSSNYFKYPMELMQDDAHMGAMMFEIYDTNPANLDTQRNRFTFINEDAAKAAKDAQAAAQSGEVSTDLGDVVGAVVNAAGGAIGQVAEGLVTTFAGGTLNPPRGGANRLARNSFTEEATGIKGGTSRVNARIYLYIPNNIEAGYGFEYETTNMSALDVMKLPKAIGQGDAEVANAIGKKIAMANMKVLDSYAEKMGVEAGTLAKSIQASQRQISNPMQLHLFKEVKRRSFSFSYVFIPKSKAEMMNCHAIINMFKYYAHPATSGAGRFLDYPAEFEIKFIQQDRVNGYLPYIFKCALTGIKVTYGEDTVMSTLMDDVEDPLGAPPTKIKMELTFDELEILTRDRFTVTPGAPNP